MINRIKEAIGAFVTDEKVEKEEPKLVIIDPLALQEAMKEEEPRSHLLGLFAEVAEEKIAELIHALLLVTESEFAKDEEDRIPVDFYLSTYGGAADDMFALYDIMRLVRQDVTLRTVGLGKVMSAGVLLLAAGTKGERRIAKNCRVMIHSVVGGNHGDLHNMLNEMEAIEQLQQMFVDCLVSETKMTKARLKKILDRKVNVYLSAEEAVELGIADIII
jgi:ATP-dependent Clp endopeptidase proteolytic subunit ClpP